MTTDTKKRAGGSVPFPRSLLHSAAFKHGPWVWMVFSWLYMRARFKDGKVETEAGLVLLRRGQVLVGCGQLERALSSKRHTLTRATYRRALKCLEKNHLVDTKPTSRGTIVTICGYDDRVSFSKRSHKRKNQPSGHVANKYRTGNNHPNAQEGTGQTTTKKKDVQEGGEQENDAREGGENERGEGVLGTEGTHTSQSLFDSLSSVWQQVTRHRIRWTDERRSQVEGLLRQDYSSQDLLDAVAKYGEIKSLPDPYIPRDWIFEDFFTPRTISLVLEKPISYFKQHPKNKRRSQDLQEVAGDTPLAAYDEGCTDEGE